jgi:hypothetical protein
MEFLIHIFPKECQLRKRGLPEMVGLSEHKSRSEFATIFGGNSDMPRKGTTSGGRPRSIKLSPDQVEIIADALKNASTFLMDSAKFMRENNLDGITLPAAKVMDEHLPALSTFSRRLFAEVGPAATQKALGRPTRLEANQQRYEKYGKGKK